MEVVERLSSEVIVHILSYLTLRDRKNVALVNKAWYYATVHPKFIKNEIFVFDCSHLNNRLTVVNIRNRSKAVIDLKDFINTIMNSKRTILNIKFIHVTCLQRITLPLFSNRGLIIRSLYFDCKNILFDNFFDNSLSNSYLTQIMSQCRNLETLSISNFNISLRNNVPQNSLPKLTFLNLYGSNLSGNVNSFSQFMKNFPNLKTLCFEYVKTHEIIGIPYNNTDNNYATVFNVINSFNLSINTLKIDELKVFFHISANLKLNALKINCYMLSDGDETLVTDLKEKLGEQKSTLKELEIKRIPAYLLSTISVLENLEQLKIRSILINNHHDKSYLKPFLRSLSKMKHLKKLSIWSKYSPNYNERLFVLSQNTLRNLTSLDYYIYDTKKILRDGKNLEQLRIYDGDILTANDIHLLFNKLTNLKCLQIDNCNNLNDNTFSMLPISNLRELLTLKINGVEIGHLCLRGIKHPNLKFLYIDKISFSDNKLIPNSIIWMRFEESIKILIHSVPNLTVLGLEFVNTNNRVYNNILKRYYKLLKELGIQKPIFKIY